MNLAQLASLLEDWYGAGPGTLGIDTARTANLANPILREFYERLGGLAEKGTPFSHRLSRRGPLAAQDRVLPLNELRREDDATVFVTENQDVFVIAASDNADQTNALVSGDVGDLSLRHLTDLGIPLSELVVTLVLKETIFSVQDRYRAPSPLKSRTSAISGTHYRGRYVWPEHYFDFWLANDVWFMDHFGGWAAYRNHWKQPPA